jgi:hypothetical protein
MLGKPIQMSRLLLRLHIGRLGQLREPVEKFRIRSIIQMNYLITKCNEA